MLSTGLEVGTLGLSLISNGLTGRIRTTTNCVILDFFTAFRFKTAKNYEKNTARSCLLTVDPKSYA